MKGSHEALAGLRSQSSSAAGTVTDRRDADRGAGHRTGDSLARAVRDKVGATTPLTIYDTLANAWFTMILHDGRDIKAVSDDRKGSHGPRKHLEIVREAQGPPGDERGTGRAV